MASASPSPTGIGRSAGGEQVGDRGLGDAAAVIAGSVLEEHLRKLATKHSVPTNAGDRPLKADALNAEPVKAGAYNKLAQKSVTAWLGVRNDAAHGHYDQYDKGQVEALIRDLQSFLERYPA